jgi:hypothetical protein
MWRWVSNEVPWMLAVMVSCTAILSAIPALNHPWGSNWPMYFESARYFWDPSAVYFGWRPPIYPLALASLGNQMGYVEAAHLMAQVSMVIVVASTGLFARLMAGVWPAMLAALSLPLLQCAVEGAMWTNMYPPAAAALAIAAALGAATWRHPGFGMALLAGLSAGLAWRINHLGLVAVPMGLGLTLLGASKRGSLQRWIGLPLLFSLGVGGLATVDAWVVKRWNVPQEGLADQVIQRRREELDRLASQPPSENQFSACTDFTPKPINLTELTNACGQQFIASNYGTLESEDCAPSIPTLMWLLPLTLLPAAKRRDWRDSAASVLVFGGPIGAFIVAAGWTSYAEKYAISYLPMMALLVPLAFDRAGGWVGRLFDRIPLGRLLGFGAALTWLVMTWPGAKHAAADQPNIQTDWESVAGRVAGWSKENLEPNDTLIDCVPLNIDLILLPTIRTTLEGVSTEHSCMGWSIEPPESSGRIWMVQQAFSDITDTQPAHMVRHGWVLIEQYDDRHRLWLYKP